MYCEIIIILQALKFKVFKAYIQLTQMLTLCMIIWLVLYIAIATKKCFGCRIIGQVIICSGFCFTYVSLIAFFMSRTCRDFVTICMPWCLKCQQERVYSTTHTATTHLQTISKSTNLHSLKVSLVFPQENPRNFMPTKINENTVLGNHMVSSHTQCTRGYL